MYSEKHEFLKKQVEKVFGRKVLTASDCHYLSIDIYRVTELKISLNTLRRFFNLMKSKYQPSVFTLNLLSKYCGFSSFSDFSAHKGMEEVEGGSIDQGTIFLNFLILLFKKIEVKDVSDTTYMHLIREVVNNLHQWPNNIIDRFHREVAKTTNGQKIYYEQFINIDKLNQFYGNGLQHYLLEKKEAEAQIFGHSLLCQRFWLTMNQEGFKTHFSKLSQYAAADASNASVRGRYFAAQLYAADVFGYDWQAVLAQANATINLTKSSASVYPIFEHILAEALVLTGKYKEALFYSEEALCRRSLSSSLPDYLDLRLHDSARLFKAIALAHLGKTEAAKALLHQISTQSFYFLSRQFHSILYLQLHQHFQQRGVVQKQLLHLVGQTGFRRLLAGEGLLAQAAQP